MRVLCVAGARPNFMKVKPIVDAFDRVGVETTLVHTGQHYDASMSQTFFEELGLRAPDFHLGVGSGSHGAQTGRIMTAFEPVLTAERPDVVVVVGDVNSTVACAIVAAKCGSLVAHVEAGLRSRDWSMPEEINRVITDRISDYLFASSADAVKNLRAEGYREDQIHLVGNVMIDTLHASVDRAKERPVLRGLGLLPKRYGLVTLHRPANVDDPAVLGELLGALGEVGAVMPLVFPVHPRARDAVEAHGVGDGVTLVDPLGYLDFLALEAQAAIVLTDSGGVQEETTALGVPCLTLRDNTERPITVDEGTNQVVGRDRRLIVETALRVKRDGVPARCPALWDGHAGSRIAEVILTGGPASSRARPTDLVTEPPH